jgi:hypothetical protein
LPRIGKAQPKGYPLIAHQRMMCTSHFLSRHTASDMPSDVLQRPWNWPTAERAPIDHSTCDATTFRPIVKYLLPRNLNFFL